MEIIKIQIHVTRNVGKVWIGRKKSLPAPFHAISGNFTHGPTKSKKYKKRGSFLFAIFLGGPMGPIHPVRGHLQPQPNTMH